MHGNEETGRISPVSDTGEDRNGPEIGSYDPTGEDFLHDSAIDEQFERRTATAAAAAWEDTEQRLRYAITELAAWVENTEPSGGGSDPRVTDSDDLPHGNDACHHCGGSITGDEVSIEGDLALQDARCDACEASWTDIYSAWQRIDHGDDPRRGQLVGMVRELAAIAELEQQGVDSSPSPTHSGFCGDDGAVCFACGEES